jgi:hypothetical protein
MQSGTVSPVLTASTNASLADCSATPRAELIGVPT